MHLCVFWSLQNNSSITFVPRLHSSRARCPPPSRAGTGLRGSRRAARTGERFPRLAQLQSPHPCNGDEKSTDFNSSNSHGAWNLNVVSKQRTLVHCCVTFCCKSVGLRSSVYKNAEHGTQNRDGVHVEEARLALGGVSNSLIISLSSASQAPGHGISETHLFTLRMSRLDLY